MAKVSFNHWRLKEGPRFAGLGYGEGEMDMKSHNYCTHCCIRGHWIEKCWKLHPELGPKKEKQAM
jgi:hypothetical protein